ncbi:hypothetical protein HYDPIDRAFT_27064 [Hydnomerulius pinastri MD-312]|nr:hypothetical protein HYDPIDRAFT_27064 [Hydnomerulius pinastri MD-312]
MSLSLKAELETWASALKAYDEQDFDKALELFSRIADSSKILTNMGLIYATIGEHETAVEQFTAATNLDSYLAVAYFQCGVSNFLLGRYDLAFTNFEEALLYLRGNQAINYEQIGLKFKLFSAEILFNKGLSQIYLGYPQEGMYDLEEAKKEKVTEEHNVIDDAIRDRGEGYTVFSIPVGVLYRPSENKLKNSKSKDYLGKAKLVAASDANDAFTEFSGVTRLKQSASAQGTFIEKPKTDADTAPGLNRSATAPAPRSDPVSTVHRPALGIERSKTTIQVPTDARERINGARSPQAPPSRPTTPASRRSQSVSNPANVPPPPNLSELRGLSRSNTSFAGSGLSRSNTTTAPLRPKTPQINGGGAPRPGENGMSRGMSVRRPQQPQQPSAPLPPPFINAPPPRNAAFTLPAVPPTVQEQPRLTDFYDDYVNAYTDDPARSLILASGVVSPQPQPQFQPNERSVAWAQGSATSSPNMSSSSNSSMMNNNIGNAITREPSRSATSPYSANSMGTNNLNNGGGTLRRKPTRRPTVRRATMYEEEDDGFSGEYDEGPFELNNIRVKLYYQGDVRGMTFAPETTFEEFVERVTTKFGTAMNGLGLKFKDEDGVKITLRDDSDYELAIETARESAKGKPEGKLEIWCTDM